MLLKTIESAKENGAQRTTIIADFLGDVQRLYDAYIRQPNSFLLVSENDYSFMINTEQSKLLLSELLEIKNLLRKPIEQATPLEAPSIFTLLLSEITEIKNAIKQQNNNSDR